MSDNFWTFVGGSTVAELPPACSGADEAVGFLDGLVSELAARPGALCLLERKLVTLENSQQLMPAEGGWWMGGRVGQWVREQEERRDRGGGVLLNQPLPGLMFRWSQTTPRFGPAPASSDFKLVLRQVGSQMPDDGVAALIARYAPPGAKAGSSIDAGLFRNDLRVAASAAGLR